MTRPQAVKLFKTISYVGIYGGLLMPLVFIPVVIFPFVFSKLIVFQILIGLTFPAYLALAWMEPRFRPPRALLYYAIIAYFVALGLSVVFSVDPLRSWWGNQERMNGLFTLLHFFAWLTMAVGVIKTWDGWKRLLNYEIVLSVFMAAVSLLQLVKKDLLLFEASGRVGGLLDNPIYMGAYQIFNLSFLALLFMKTRSRLARLLYVAAAIVDMAAFAVTESRGALVGLAAVIGSFALYYAFFTKNRKARWGILSGAGAFFAAYGVAYLFRDSAFIMGNGILSRLTHFSAASETRLIAWSIAWKGFLERPITGWGLDAFHVLFNLHYNPRSLEFGQYETWFDRAHNTVFDVLSMTGILGFVTFFAIFALLFYSVWRAQKKQWIDLPIAAVLVALPIGYFLQNLFVFDHPAAFSMSYLLFAFVIAATQKGFMDSAPPPPPETAKTRPASWTLFVIAQLVLLLIVWRYSVLPFRASLLTIQANKVFSVQLDEAWNLVQEAGKLPTPYLDEQTYLFSRDFSALVPGGRIAQAPFWRDMYAHLKQLNEREIARHPRNTNLHFVYARFLQDTVTGMPSQFSPEEQSEELALSEQEFRRAIETSPKRQQLFYSLARFYSVIGQPQQAHDELARALAFNPNVGESWWYKGMIAWFDLGNVEEGMQSVVQAMNAKASYGLQQARDAGFVATAASALGDQELLKRLLTILPSLPGGSVDLYLDIARAYERSGLMEERNLILNAVEQADPSVGPRLEALRNGSAQTIDESIAAASSTAEPASAPVPDAQNVAPIEEPTTDEGTGPRR